MAFAEFQENRFSIDGEIAENHAILVNLTASINKCKGLLSNWTTMSNFHSLEVVGRGSETQFQVGENLNQIP